MLHPLVQTRHRQNHSAACDRPSTLRPPPHSFLGLANDVAPQAQLPARVIERPVGGRLGLSGSPGGLQYAVADVAPSPQQYAALFQDGHAGIPSRLVRIP